MPLSKGEGVGGIPMHLLPAMVHPNRGRYQLPEVRFLLSQFGSRILDSGCWQRCFILPELQESLLVFPPMSLLTQSPPGSNHLQMLPRELSASQEEVPVLLLKEHRFYQSSVTEIDSVTI